MNLFSRTILLSLLCMFAVFANQLPPDNPPYKNAGLPVETRVADLLTRMTLEEKIDILGGTGFATMPNDRLGIPELRMTDGPLGVRWDKATAFPSGISLG
ncbi:MAG: glycoside hydrolase family 3 protein, partial [Ignavibacteriales bacterium]|nr:glycoside hydrolase family 3 protein [Ignavibacteriales bacterium]